MLGPPDGRYLLRRPGDSESAPPAHVLVITTLGAPERRRFTKRRRRQAAAPEPEPTPVATSRATIIDVGEPLPTADEGQAWLQQAGEDDFRELLAVLNHALHAFRVVTADPYLGAVVREQLLVARIGYGAGEQVADGQWTDANELVSVAGRQRRAVVLQPQARLAAILNGRERALVCQELVLRARLDFDHGRDREAALQVLVALDAALAELPSDPTASQLGARLAELYDRRELTVQIAQAALAGPLDDDSREAVEFTLRRIEAVLRARAVASA